MLYTFDELFGASPLVCVSRGLEGHVYIGVEWPLDKEVRGTAAGPPATPKGSEIVKVRLQNGARTSLTLTLFSSFCSSLMRINQHFYKAFNYTA